jgi:hypothetical protein
LNKTKGFLTGEDGHTAETRDVELHRKGGVDYTDSISVFSDDEDSTIDESKFSFK